MGNKAIDWAFDYGLYPIALWHLGPLAGGALMMAASLLACYATLRFYDWSRQDWLGIETLKGLSTGTRCWNRSLAALLSHGNWLTFLVLSVQFDPFITTAAMRHGAFRFNGMAARDWRIFFGSVVVGNCYWSLLVAGGIKLIEKIWP